MGLILLLITFILLIGALPNWPHTRSWGYGPSGVLAALLIALIVLSILKVVPFV